MHHGRFIVVTLMLRCCYADIKMLLQEGFSVIMRLGASCEERFTHSLITPPSIPEGGPFCCRLMVLVIQSLLYGSYIEEKN